MPLISYDYLCRACKKVFDFIIDKEVVDTPDEQIATLCPECGKRTERLFPAPIWKWTAGSRGF